MDKLLWLRVHLRNLLLKVLNPSARLVSVPLCKEDAARTTKWPSVGHWCEYLTTQSETDFMKAANGPLVGPVLNAWHQGAQVAFAIEYQDWYFHHWCPELFRDENRFTLSTCESCERVRRSYGGHYAGCNIVQHDWFNGGSVIIWGGISTERSVCHTETHRPLQHRQWRPDCH